MILILIAAPVALVLAATVLAKRWVAKHTMPEWYRLCAAGQAALWPDGTVRYLSKETTVDVGPFFFVYIVNCGHWKEKDASTGVTIHPQDMHLIKPLTKAEAKAYESLNKQEPTP